MSNKKSVLFTVIFFGAVWGILEATLGYGLHYLPDFISGSVMFPIGAALMFWAYRSTQKRSSVFYVALIAASLKAVNFLMPFTMALKIYDPMIAILLQSVVVFAAVTFMEKKSLPLQLGTVAASSLAWRTLFIVNQYVNHAITGFNHGQLASVNTLMTFIFLNAIFEILVMLAFYVAYHFAGKKVRVSLKPHWLLSLSTLAVAIALVVIL
ncbi:MAG: hypothetical protein NTV44_00530 [Firmicutes bacterium]|nr:hypothetical protein [Bacillota bacterium]